MTIRDEDSEESSMVLESVKSLERKNLAKRTQALLVNAKSFAFDRGFISAEGIKDREWYKHLAVAPGKWLDSTLVQQLKLLDIDSIFLLIILQKTIKLKETCVGRYT